MSARRPTLLCGSGLDLDLARGGSFLPFLAGLSKLLESGQREQIVLLCLGQVLQVDHGRQVSGQGK
jgi:hypothetical protein